MNLRKNYNEEKENSTEYKYVTPEFVEQVISVLASLQQNEAKKRYSQRDDNLLDNIDSLFKKIGYALEIPQYKLPFYDFERTELGKNVYEHITAAMQLLKEYKVSVATDPTVFYFNQLSQIYDDILINCALSQLYADPFVSQLIFQCIALHVPKELATIVKGYLDPADPKTVAEYEIQFLITPYFLQHLLPVLKKNDCDKETKALIKKN